MTKYLVYLHGHAGVEMHVEANSTEEANRLALEKAPKVQGVSSWTPVGTVNLDQGAKKKPDPS